MTIINVNSISGINSITAQGASGIEFFDSSGSSVQKVTGDGLTVGTGATISGSTNEVIVRTADASSTALRLRSDGGGTNGGHLEGEGPKITFDAKRGADGGNSPASYIQQVAIGDLGSSWPVDLAFGVRRFGSSFEALRIASTGNVGIGTTLTGASSNTKLTLQTTGSSACRLVLANSGSSTAESTQIWSQNDELAFNAGGSEQARITADGLKLASGNGINFSAYATSGNPSSNLLDDYEEGTWTPVIKSGTNTISYSGGNQNFYYVKIGCLVTATFTLNGAVTSGTTGGGFTIEGLPFVSKNVSNFRTIGTIFNYYGSGLRASTWPNFIHLGSNSSTVDIYTKTSSSGNYDRDTVSSVGSDTYVMWQITYQAA